LSCDFNLVSGISISTIRSLGFSLVSNVSPIDSPGQGLVLSGSVGTVELVVSPTSKKVNLTEVVGSVVGITCDGQEGMKVNCFKRIIVDNQGREGGSFADAVQQETVSCDQERGNCSDYEA
jgi:hypothetical protein